MSAPIARIQSQDEGLNRLQDQLAQKVNPIIEALRLEYLTAVPKNALLTTPTQAGNFSTAVVAVAKASVPALVVPVPTSSASPGKRGDVCCDASNIYFCVAPNLWRKIALTAW